MVLVIVNDSFRILILFLMLKSNLQSKIALFTSIIMNANGIVVFWANVVAQELCS